MELPLPVQPCHHHFHRVKSSPSFNGIQILLPQGLGPEMQQSALLVISDLINQIQPVLFYYNPFHIFLPLLSLFLFSNP